MFVPLLQLVLTAIFHPRAALLLVVLIVAGLLAYVLWPSREES